MDGRQALDRLHALLAQLQQLVAAAQRGELDAAEAVHRIDAVLGPPVWPDPVPGDSPHAAAVRDCEAVIDDCRREIDRVRAAMVRPQDTLDAIRGRLARAGPDVCMPSA